MSDVGTMTPPEAETNQGRTGVFGRLRHAVRHIFRAKEMGILVALLLLSALLILSTPNFLTPSNLLGITRQMSLVAIIGVGMSFLIISGEFDLSIGSMFGLSGIVAALLVRDYGWNIWFTVPVCLGLGALVGLFNGTMVTRVGIPSFVVTLGMLQILRGAALVISGGWPISDLPESTFFSVFAGRVNSLIPAQTFWMVAILLIGGFVLSRTKYGYHVYATGGNVVAARRNGINTHRVKTTNFMLTSMLAALAGLITLAHLSSVAPTQGMGMELDVIAAVVIGGTALMGGAGSIFGMFLGAATISVIRNGLVLLSVSAYWQTAIIGVVIIVAVTVDVLGSKRRTTE